MILDVFKLDEMVRLGEGIRVAHIIQRSSLKNLNREAATKLANICRRVGLAHTGLKILNPMVHPSSSKFAVATADETLEYGALLIQLNLHHEGISLLQSIDQTAHPNTLLYQAFGLFAEWNYSSAIPLLEKYKEAKNISEYQRYLGYLNLLAAYVETQNFSQFDQHFNELKKYFEQNKYDLLLGNLHEIAAQYFLFNQEPILAKKYLIRAEQLLKKSGSLNFFFVNKWNYITELYTNTHHADHSAYTQLMSDAKLQGFAEGVRDIDLYRNIKNKNRAGLDFLYWGTPYASYQNKICRLVQEETLSWNPPTHFTWSPQPIMQQSLTSETQFNLESQVLKIINPSQNKTLIENSLLYRLFFILCRDFYRSYKIPELHGYLYPDQYYNPITSPEKMKQLFLRLREFIISQKWPLQLVTKNGHWYFQAKTDVAIELNSLASADLSFEKKWLVEKLKLHSMKNKSFTLKELRLHSLLPNSVLQRELKKALELGLVLKESVGRYSMTS